MGFSISGIRVRIDRTWFIALVLFAWTLSVGYFPLQAPDYARSAYWVAGTISALALFASVLGHELSHSIVARRLGLPVHQITLFIFGGVSEIEQSNSHSPRMEFQVAIAGPVSSIAIGLAFAALTYVLHNSVNRLVLEILGYLAYVNLLLAAFNLIPGFPLDGGRVLRAYLWQHNGDAMKATRSAARVGAVFASILIGLGVLSFVMSRFIAGVWLLLIGLFLQRSAESEYRSSEARNGLQNLTVGDIMTPPVSIPSDITAAQLISDYVFHYHHRIFPVVDDNQFVGMLDIRALKTLNPGQWPFTRIERFMSNPANYLVLNPEMSALAALNALLSSPMAKAAVVRDGVLLGILTRNDLFKTVALKHDLAA